MNRQAMLEDIESISEQFEIAEDAGCSFLLSLKRAGFGAPQIVRTGSLAMVTWWRLPE